MVPDEATGTGHQCPFRHVLPPNVMDELRLVLWILGFAETHRVGPPWGHTFACVPKVIIRVGPYETRASPPPPGYSPCFPPNLRRPRSSSKNSARNLGLCLA